MVSCICSSERKWYVRVPVADPMEHIVSLRSWPGVDSDPAVSVFPGPSLQQTPAMGVNPVDSSAVQLACIQNRTRSTVSRRDDQTAV